VMRVADISTVADMPVIASPADEWHGRNSGSEGRCIARAGPGDAPGAATRTRGRAAGCGARDPGAGYGCWTGYGDVGEADAEPRPLRSGVVFPLAVIRLQRVPSAAAMIASAGSPMFERAPAASWSWATTGIVVFIGKAHGAIGHRP